MPTQEAMAALGRQHLATLRKDVKTEVSVTKPKLTNQEMKTTNESMESEPRLDEVMAGNSSWHAPETNQVQFNSPDAVSRNLYTTCFSYPLQRHVVKIIILHMYRNLSPALHH